MSAGHRLLERGIPDLVDTAPLPRALAAEIDFLAGRNEAWTATDRPMLAARALTASGREGEALALLDAAEPDGLDPQELAAAAWVAARIGSTPTAVALLDALDLHPDFLSTDHVPLGPRALLEGPLLAATGDLDAAQCRLRAAVEAGDARAPLWGALARLELARVVACAGAVASPDDGDDHGRRVAQLVGAAGLFFRAGGHRALLERTQRLLDPGDPAPLGAPTTGRLRPGRRWRVGFGVTGDVSVRDAKGLVALRHLVQHPGRSVPSLVLDRLADGGDPDDLGALADAFIDVGEAEIRARLMDDGVRSRMGKLLTRTIARLDDAHPLLGAHLRTSVHTGHSCRYEPPVGVAAIGWTVDHPSDEDRSDEDRSGHSA